MYIYPTAKLDIPEGFRAEFCQFFSRMVITVAQDIHNRGGQC